MCYNGSIHLVPLNEVREIAFRKEGIRRKILDVGIIVILVFAVLWDAFGITPKRTLTASHTAARATKGSLLALL